MVEAELINFDGIPALSDTAKTLWLTYEIVYDFYLEGILAGVISYEMKEEVLHICRLVVHPDFLEKGSQAT